MFGSASGKKQRPSGGSAGFLVRPRLGALKSVYSTRPFAAHSPEKRKKIKKSGPPKMDWRRGKPDSADTAHREAVSRLRILLAESYVPVKRPLRELDSAGEETDNQSIVSAGSRNSRISRNYHHYSSPVVPRKYFYYPRVRGGYGGLGAESDKPALLQESPSKIENSSTAPELMSFIERQDEYIEELEKESKFCKEELSTLLSKVKEVINENEHLHDKQRSRMIKSLFQHIETETETETETDNKNILRSPKKPKTTRLMEGPSIVFESRISELEAQLAQARIDLKKSHEENETLRKKINDGTILDTVGYESYKMQLENLQREKQTLQDTVQKLNSTLTILKDKESECKEKVKRSLDVAEQTQYEKSAAESEIRRLKDELDRQHMKLREAIADQGRRIADERSAVERRYTQQIEQLSAELGAQWETTNKLHLELDIQRRENGDLRREAAQKQALIDELKKDMQNRIVTLQSDIGVSGAEKGALEQQIAALQMTNERNERQSKQEIVRLQAEIQSLRLRLDRADADLIHSRRENIRMGEQVASLEKEIALSNAIADERNKTPRGNEIVALPPPISQKDDRDKEMTSMIHDLENKHGTDAENPKNESDSLFVRPTKRKEPIKVDVTVKVVPKPRKNRQDPTTEKKFRTFDSIGENVDFSEENAWEEIRELQANLEFLSNRFSQSQLSSNLKDEGHTPNSNQRNTTTKPTNSALSRVTPDSQALPTRVNPSTNLENPTKNVEQIAKDPVKSPPRKVSDSNDQQPYQEEAIASQPQPETQNYDDTFSQQQQDFEQVEGHYPENYDPNQHFDVDQTYDPNQHYEHDQQYQEYDPSQHYEQYDPGQYDPNMQYDPNQHFGEADPQSNEMYQGVVEGISNESVKAGDDEGGQ